MCVRKWLEDYRLTQQIKRLSDEKRQAILEKSLLSAEAFQDEGFGVQVVLEQKATLVVQ